MRRGELPVGSGKFGEHQKVGGQAALRSGSCVCGCDLNFGYQRRNRSSRSSLRTLVLVCSKRWAPRSVHCIFCFLTNRLLTTWLIVDSTKAVEIVSPCRRRSPKFGMNSLFKEKYRFDDSDYPQRSGANGPQIRR